MHDSGDNYLDLLRQRLVLLSGLVLMSGCSKLSGSQVESMLAPFHSCSLISPGQYRPVLNLSPSDAGMEIRAREYIELKRRHIKDTWNVAGTVFAVEQARFAGDEAYVPEYASRAAKSVQQYLKGEFPFNETLEEHLARLKLSFDDACAARDKNAGQMAALEPLLKTIREESVKPWLDPDKQLPCAVMRTPTCRQ